VSTSRRSHALARRPLSRPLPWPPPSVLPRRHPFALSLALALTFVCFGPSHRHAAGTRAALASDIDKAVMEGAVQIFEAGVERFNAKDFASALTLFEKAHTIYPNPFLEYYLGRTLAALDRCEEALPHLAGLRGRMPTTENTAKAEGLRAADAGRCRLAISEAALGEWRCSEAARQAEAVVPGEVSPELATKRASLLAAANLCVQRFDDDGTSSQSAARLHAAAAALLAEDRATEALQRAGESLAARPSDAANLIKAAALTDLGRCSEALPLLKSLQGKLEGPDEAERERRSQTCSQMAPPEPVRSDPALPTQVTSVQSKPKKGLRVAGIASLGAGAVLVGLGTWRAVDALQKADRVNASNDLTCDRCESQSMWGWTLAGVGVAAVATGVTLLILGRKKSAPATTRVSFNAWADRHGASAFIRISTPE
jgi:tetratricopeptide (TPR) repeat protein